MKKAAVILAGGFSRRFGQDKCLIRLAGKPLVRHVIDRVSAVVDERVVVVGSNAQREPFARLLKSKAVVVDEYEGHSPLVGALTGLESVSADYSLLMPCDTPFVSPEIAALLFDLCINKGAAVPRWPNGYIEPLHAVYHTKAAMETGQQALRNGKRNMLSMINSLGRVRYVSTLVLQQLDSQLLTFFNINTPESLRRAELILNEGK